MLLAREKESKYEHIKQKNDKSYYQSLREAFDKAQGRVVQRG